MKMKTGIRRGVKQFFSDMTRKERKEYLKAVETRIAAWHDKIAEVLNGNILEVLQEGYYPLHPPNSIIKNITILYYNPNITDKNEYEKRLEILGENHPDTISAMISLAPAIASSALTTVHSLPWNVILRPTDLAEATGRSSVTGKFLSARTSSILVPTKPVAPTTATFIFSNVISFIIVNQFI